MGYAGYFLIVADFIAFARAEGIATTCRGSAPGSIVTYTLGITPVDPDPLPAAVRALPQPRPRDDARHRRGLRGQPARRGDRLRHPQVRRGSGRPDHHVRHDARPGRDPGRRPGHGPRLRRGGPDREGRAEPARDQARGSAPGLTPAARDDRGGSHRREAHRPRRAAGRRRPQRQHARRRCRDQPRAPRRADAAPEGDELGRAHDPVRDARAWRRWGCSSSTSWASRT